MFNRELSNRIATKFKIPRGHADCYQVNYRKGYKCINCKSYNVCKNIDKQFGDK